jgi:hypothetical protein
VALAKSFDMALSVRLPAGRHADRPHSLVSYLSQRNIVTDG